MIISIRVISILCLLYSALLFASTIVVGHGHFRPPEIMYAIEKAMETNNQEDWWEVRLLAKQEMQKSTKLQNRQISELRTIAAPMSLLAAL